MYAHNNCAIPLINGGIFVIVDTGVAIIIVVTQAPNNCSSSTMALILGKPGLCPENTGGC